MDVFCAVDNLGINTPLLLENTSSLAAALGGLIPIPTLCAIQIWYKLKADRIRQARFITLEFGPNVFKWQTVFLYKTVISGFHLVIDGFKS